MCLRCWKKSWFISSPNIIRWIQMVAGGKKRKKKSAVLYLFQGRCRKSVRVTYSLKLSLCQQRPVICCYVYLCEFMQSVVWIMRGFCAGVWRHPFLSVCVNVCLCDALLIPRCAKQVVTLVSTKRNCRHESPRTTAHVQTLMYHHLPGRKRAQ